MNIKIKKLHINAVTPTYSREGDAGLDLTAVSKVYDEYGNVHYGTGLSFEIPEGYVGLLFPRSSNAKKDLLLSNSVGVLDSNYRGEVRFKFKPSLVLYDDGNFAPIGKLGTEGNNYSHIVPPIEEYKLDFQQYEVGDRIGQIIVLPYPKITFEEVDELTDTERGDGAYGSSGN